MQIKVRALALKCVYPAGFLLILGFAWVSPLAAQTVSGRSYAAYVNVPSKGAGPLYVADTGTLTELGGWLGEGLVRTSIPGVLSAEVPTAATSGEGANRKSDNVKSSSSSTKVTILPGDPAQVTASLVRSQGAVSFNKVDGSSEIHELTFGGVPITVTGEPNQTVSLSGKGTLIINEQIVSRGSNRSITVNALHLKLLDGGEVILSSSTSGLAF